MREVGTTISEAIKTGKWLYIDYRNRENQRTSYWCSVIDVHPRDKRLTVKMFNPHLSEEIIEAKLFFDGVISAQIIDGTTYEVPARLIETIEKNPAPYEWLNFDSFNNNILMYLRECYFYDNDPYQREYHFIDGVDCDVLRSSRAYGLSAVQTGQIIDFIYKTDIDAFSKNKHTYLALNFFSISINKKLYVIAYYDVLFDVEKQTLVLSRNLKINKSFLIGDRKYSLKQFVDINPNEFIEKFASDYRYYSEIIARNLTSGEMIDESPYLMVLERNVPMNIDNVFAAIAQMHQKQSMTPPLKAFFGNITTRDEVSGAEDYVYFSDDKFNEDQLRVVYNTVKSPLTYVQGPPGTGKTSTIFNILLSAFMNEKSVLIASNNNKPINDIFKKIKFTHLDKEIPFPALRIGVLEENIKTLKRIKEFYYKSKNVVIKEGQLKNIKLKAKEKYGQLNAAIEKHEELIALREEKETLLSMHDNVDNNFKNMLAIEINLVDEKIRKIGRLPDLRKLAYVGRKDRQYTSYLYYKSFSYWKMLYTPEYRDLVEIVHMPDGNKEERKEKNRAFLKYLADDENFLLFVRAFPFILSTNLSANKLGSPKPFFDYVIIDEAGQCNIATSLIPMIRGRRLVLFGDPSQLRPVIVLDEEVNRKLREKYQISDTYDYINNSIIEVMQKKDRVSPSILLRYHYRCGKKIINFSNRRYYGNRLKIETDELPEQLEFYNVKSDETAGERNTSYQEAATIADIIKKNNYKNVAVITPFRNQSALISGMLEADRIKGVDVGTIHTFQGDERDVVIMSLALSPSTGEKTYNWVKDNSELINVAVTRPKNKLIIVGDYDLIAERAKNQEKGENDDLYSLVSYVQKNGNCYVPPKKEESYQFFRQYNTAKEKDFLRTISHMMTTMPAYTVQSKVKVASVFNLDPRDNFDYYTRAEFDFVIFEKASGRPLIVFEVDGPEHINNYRTIRNDRKKEDICRRRNVKLIRVPNENVRRYNLIKNILLRRCLSS